MRLTLNPKVEVKPAESIMVGFLAASAVEGDCWKEEVCWVVNALSQMPPTYTPVQYYKETKASYEGEFKEKNGLKQMPSKYRSAKSVICKALAHNVELLDEEGYPRGKTEVEKDIKLIGNKAFIAVIKDTALELDGDSEPDKPNTYEKCFYAAEFLRKNYHSIGNTEQDVIKNLLSGII